MLGRHGRVHAFFDLAWNEGEVGKGRLDTATCGCVVVLLCYVCLFFLIFSFKYRGFPTRMVYPKHEL